MQNKITTSELVSIALDFQRQRNKCLDFLAEILKKQRAGKKFTGACDDFFNDIFCEIRATDTAWDNKYDYLVCNGDI